MKECECELSIVSERTCRVSNEVIGAEIVFPKEKNLKGNKARFVKNKSEMRRMFIT